MQLLQQLEVVAAADAVGGGRPFADAVDGEDRRLLERRREEGARGMGLVVLRVEQLAVVAERASDFPVQEQFSLHPQRAGHPKLCEPARCDAELRLEYPLELEKGLVVKPDEGEVGGRDPARGLEAIPGGLERKRRVPLLASEALLLRGCDDFAVPQEAGGAVVVEGGDAKDVVGGHGRSALPHGGGQWPGGESLVAREGSTHRSPGCIVGCAAGARASIVRGWGRGRGGRG